MNVARRAIAVLTDPAGAWTAIEKDPAGPLYLMTRYVAALALIPAVCGWLGACVIGVIVPGGGVVRASLFNGFFGAVFGYLEELASVAVLGFLIEAFAPLFGGRRDFASSLKLAAYSYTPVWLTGIFRLLPGLHFLMLFGLYGVRVLIIGLPQLIKSPSGKSRAFAALIVVFAGALAYFAAAARLALFANSGG
jgi:Yip1 domain